MTNYDYLYNKEYFGDTLNKNYFSDNELHFRFFENATILPHKDIPDTTGFGGLVDSKGKFIKRTSIHMGVGGAYTPNENVLYSPSTVIYLGMLMPIWGHCLTDNLKRIWFLKSDTYKQYFKKCQIVYTPMWGGIVSNYAKLLEILNIDAEKLIPINSPIKFKNVILPDESFFLDDTGSVDEDKYFFQANARFTKEYIETMDIIREFAMKNYKPLNQKKFFFMHGSGNQVGEERLAEYFKTKGYEIVTPGKLSLEEQLNIYSNCESFASTLGSVSHNVIFLKNNSEVILIPSRIEKKLNTYQEALNQLRELNVSYIDSTLSIYSSSITGPFCYIISNQLKEFFGDESNEIYDDADLENFIIYLKHSIVKKIKISEEATRYYSKILPNFKGQLRQREELLKKYGLKIN